MASPVLTLPDVPPYFAPTRRSAFGPLTWLRAQLDATRRYRSAMAELRLLSQRDLDDWASGPATCRRSPARRRRAGADLRDSPGPARMSFPGAGRPPPQWAAM